jgi:hypothetical protein
MNGVLAVGRHRARARVGTCWSVGIVAACLWALTVAGAAAAQTASIQDQGKNYLMVSDGAAGKVYFYSVPDLHLTGHLI